MDERDEACAGWAITQLLYRATALMDAARWDELAGLYAEDAEMSRPSDPDNPVIGRAAILASMRQRPARTSRHVISNPVVDLISETEARVRSTVTLYSGPATAEAGAVPANGVILVGSFDDRLHRTPDGWRFTRRSGSMALEFRPGDA